MIGRALASRQMQICKGVSFAEAIRRIVFVVIGKV